MAKRIISKESIATLFVILILCFIWGHSMVPRAASSRESTKVLGEVGPWLSNIVGEKNTTEELVRKMAHATEYSWLAMAVFVRMCLNKKKIRRYKVLHMCFFVAFIDETIQIFSGRGPQIRDVWVDLLGASIGLLIATVVRKIWKYKKSSCIAQKKVLE